MMCPKCNSAATDVIDSRNAAKAVRRRRKCCTCTYRFTTYERVERPKLMVIKKNNERELFSREKLMTGIERACEKRDISKAEIETVIDAIECAIFDKNELEITTRRIGELVMDELAKLDQVAYVRFASVYREFTDIQSFATVVEMLSKNPRRENA